MSESLKAAVRSAVLRLLDPLVKWLLEAGMGVGDLLPLVKIAYVRAAREQGRRSSGELTRPNASRISVVTGLTRAEVANILAADAAEPTHDRGRQRAERVLSPAIVGGLGGTMPLSRTRPAIPPFSPCVARSARLRRWSSVT